MFNTYKALQSNKLLHCEDKFAYPVMRWMSGTPENLEVCNFTDVNFFKLKPKIIFSLLSSCPKKGFLKYPKKTKTEEAENVEIIKTALKKIYNWSDLEFEKNKIAINFEDEKFLSELNKIVGFDQKECKKLGIKFEKVEKYEYKETVKPKGKSLFDF